MLVEVAVVALAALLFALPAAAAAFGESGVTGSLVTLSRTAALGFLWAVGTAMTEILAVGNGAGFVGYIVLKKLAARSDRAAPAPDR
jgi:hypothetical protein